MFLRHFFILYKTFLLGMTLVFLASVSNASPEANADQDNVSYFIDASRSMCGYLSANDPDGPLQKVVTRAMQSKDAKRGRRVYLLGFDGKKPSLSEAPEDLAARVAQLSAASNKGSCAPFVATTSSLDTVFTQAKQTPSASMILVTDLLLKEGDLTRFVDNVREWASSSGKEGAHVGFITLSAPFNGQYFQVSGGKSNPGPHIRPITVMWLSASAAGRVEVARLLEAFGVTTEPMQSGSEVAPSRCKSKTRQSPASQVTATTPIAGVPQPRLEPASGPAVSAKAAVMFGLQVLPKLTANPAQWLVPAPERGLNNWLDLQCQMYPGSGRNRNSVDECASVRWANNALQIAVRERCNDKKLFSFKQTSAVVILKPKAATGLILESLQVTPRGAARCISIDPNAAISQCSESAPNNEALQLYRFPIAGKNSESEQTVKLKLRMLEPEDSGWLEPAERLDLANDICAGSGQGDECRTRLDGKVYRYSTFVAQLAGRAKAVMQQRIETLPSSFPVQVQIVPGAK